MPKNRLSALVAVVLVTGTVVWAAASTRPAASSSAASSASDQVDTRQIMLRTGVLPSEQYDAI